jgi:hypothetical protein
VEVSVPGGEVSEQGLLAIKERIFQVTSKGGKYQGVLLQELFDGTIDATWQTKEGNFPKRVAKALYVERQIKLTDMLMTEIGNLAKQYTSIEAVHRIGFTRDLNQGREQFVNGDSCWWTDYWYSRCSHKQMGGIGVRTFNAYDEPQTRAWLLPMEMVKTDRYGDPNPRGTRTAWLRHLEIPAPAYVLFNAYEMEALPYGRLIAQMTGKSYRKIRFVMDRAYVNTNNDGNSTGILIAEQSVCSETTEVYINPPTCGCR